MPIQRKLNPPALLFLAFLPAWNKVKNTHKHTKPHYYIQISLCHHTIGTFIYIEASVPRVKGDKARLRSKVFPASSDSQCLSFFLHMYSSNKTMMGEFNVYLSDAQHSNRSLFQLLQKTGSQPMNDWTQVQMKFKPVGDYQVKLYSIFSNYSTPVANTKRNDSQIDSL